MIAAIDTRREVLGTHVAQSVPMLALGGILPFVMSFATDSSPRDWTFFLGLPLAARVVIILAHSAVARWTSLPVHIRRERVLATAAARAAEGSGGLGVLWVLRDGILFRQGNQIVHLGANEIASVTLDDPGSLGALLGFGSGKFPLVLLARNGQEHRFTVDAPVALAGTIRSVLGAAG